MNAALFGMLSLGLMLAAFTAETREIGIAARAAADDAGVARLMDAAPDAGSAGSMVYIDPETGDSAQVDLLAFSDQAVREDLARPDLVREVGVEPTNP